MYNEARMSVNSVCREMKNFMVKISIHKGSALSLYLFLQLMDELTKGIQDEEHWYIIFANDVISVNENISVLEGKLEC